MKKRILVGFLIGLVISLGICRWVNEKYFHGVKNTNHLQTDEMYNNLYAGLPSEKKYTRETYFNTCQELPASVFPTIVSGSILCHEVGAIVDINSGGVIAIYVGGEITAKDIKLHPEYPLTFLNTISAKGTQTIYGDRGSDIATYIDYYRDNIAGYSAVYPGGKELLEKWKSTQKDIEIGDLGFENTTPQKPFEGTEGLKYCNIQRKDAPIVNISSASKICTTITTGGIIPDGLGGAEPTYLISNGKVYDTMSENTDACRYGGTATNPRRWSLSNMKTDMRAKQISTFKNRNYLTYYGGTMYAWVMVFPILNVESQPADYTEGYLDVSYVNPVFVVDDTIYNPWDATSSGQAVLMNDEAYKNNNYPNTIAHKSYTGPRVFVGKDAQGKIKVARQENIQIQYDHAGKPQFITPNNEGLGGYSVKYSINTCVLQ